MISKLLMKTVFVATGLSLAGAPTIFAAASAQDQGYLQDGRPAPPPPQGYQQPPAGYDQESQGDDQSAPPPGYDDNQAPPSGYNGGPPPASAYGNPPPGYEGAPPPPPPPGYDGSQPPPPPPGYQPGPNAAQQQAQDQQYAAYAQQWSQAYCVKARGNTGEGAVIGGVVGAILGSGLGGHGAGALAGAAVGAAGGAVIADSSGSNATSPGCPPGFVTRSGAPPFAYGGSPYIYAAPTWYRPWVLYDGAWVYRPYPYHVWYYNRYSPYRHYGRPYYGRRRW